MNRSHPIRLMLVFLLALAPLSASAEPLTDQTIRSFIKSMESLQTMEGEFEDLTDEMASESQAAQMPDLSRIFSSSVEQIKGHEAYNRLEEVVEQHGFSSAEQWSKAGDRIFQAWSALEMGQHSGMMSQEMAQAMEQINNNPNMSEAQKQQMRDMMGGAVSAMEQAANAPEADKRAVRPHMNELRSLMDAEGNR